MFKNFLKNQVKGVVAVEWVICAPFTLIITFFSIMMLIFTIDFHLISKNASNLISDLNMGDTGYTTYKTMGVGTSDMIATKNYGMNDYKLGVPGGNTSIRASITKDSNSYFYNTAKYFINKLNRDGGFTAPYCTLRNLTCRVYDEKGNERTGFSTSKGVTESGDMVVVTVQYSFCGIPVTVSSFGFIN